MKSAILLALGMAFSVSACSTGSGLGSDGAQEYQDMQFGFEVLRLNYATANQTLIMPTQGRATYNGVAGLLFGDEVDQDGSEDVASTAGRLSVTANFATGGMSGAVTDFYRNDGSSVPGALTIASGPFTGNSFSRGVSGNLEMEGQLRAISGQIDGLFVGTDAAGLVVGGYLTAAGTATPVEIFGLAEK